MPEELGGCPAGQLLPLIEFSSYLLNPLLADLQIYSAYVGLYVIGKMSSEAMTTMTKDPNCDDKREQHDGTQR